jgi:hypothetical protein
MFDFGISRWREYGGFCFLQFRNGQRAIAVFQPKGWPHSGCEWYIIEFPW